MQIINICHKHQFSFLLESRNESQNLHIYEYYCFLGLNIFHRRLIYYQNDIYKIGFEQIAAARSFPVVRNQVPVSIFI